MTAPPKAGVALVLVSHSRALAEATATLARQMTGESVAILCAAGAGEGGAELGTDALAIMEALTAADGAEGTLVLMDLGSAILSAQTALDLVEPEVKARARLLAAPFVEGAVAAAVAAASGLPLAQVAEEAMGALQPKAAQVLDEEPAPSRPAESGTPAGQEHAADVVIADPHGLHARPAAKLAIAASGFAAELTVSDLDAGTGPVSARSLVALGSLGARANHRLRVSGRGADADAAVAALAALIATFTGTVEAPPPPVPAGNGKAIPVSPGIAIGPLRELGRLMPPIPETPAGDVDAELARLRAAVESVRHQLDAPGSGPGADILAVQSVFLRDPELIGAAERLIRSERRNAADAFARAGEAAAGVYGRLEDPVLRAREADLRDAVDAVLRHLLGAEQVSLPDGEPVILVANDLPPSLAHSLDPAQVMGVIDRRGGPTSHSAILLRGGGIPALAGAATLLPESLPDTAAFDGTTGELVLAPSPEQAADFAARRARESEARAQAKVADGIVRTSDGAPIELWANVTGVRDALAARAAGALGIGLLRTEIMFLDRAAPPSEDEQVAALRAIFDVFAGRPITVRTLDAGGDKPVPYMNMPKEANPFLGVRGLRLSLKEMALFETQLRAILAAGHGHDVHIMLPMVTGADEVREARAALIRAHEALEAAKAAHAWPVPLGIMVEVPAAALAAPALCEVADFFSIGTNDLTQYTLAAERGHPGLGAFADAGHPAVLALVAHVAHAAAACGRHVAVCGEAAGDPLAAPLLVGAGVHALSMSAGALPLIAATLAAETRPVLEARARQAMAGTVGDVLAPG